MNKIWIVVMTLVFPLVFALKANAQIVSTESVKAEPRFNVSAGLGSSYGLGEESLGKLKRYSNVFTTSLRLGYSLSKYVEVQGEYSRASKFEAAHDYGSYYLRTTFAFSAFTLNVKAGVPVRIKKVSLYPYITMGAGKAYVEYHSDYRSATLQLKEGNEGSTYPCSKGGIGVEVKLHKNIYAFSELNNWKVKWKKLGNQQRYVMFYQQIITGLTMKF